MPVVDGDIGDLGARQDVLAASDLEGGGETGLTVCPAGDGDPEAVVQPSGPAVGVARLGDHQINAVGTQRLVGHADVFEPTDEGVLAELVVAPRVNHRLGVAMPRPHLLLDDEGGGAHRPACGRSNTDSPATGISTLSSASPARSCTWEATVPPAVQRDGSSILTTRNDVRPLVAARTPTGATVSVGCRRPSGPRGGRRLGSRRRRRSARLLILRLLLLGRPRPH